MSDETKMMDERQGPVRRFQLRLTLGADDWGELVHSLDQLAFHFDTDKGVREMAERLTGWNGASGGPSSGYSYDIRVDPTMTHERYIQELKAYLAELKTEPRSADNGRQERNQEHG